MYFKSLFVILLAILFLLSASKCQNNFIMQETPYGWIRAGTYPQDYEMRIDTTVRHDGHSSALIKFTGDKPKGFGTLMQAFKADDFRGKRIMMSGWMKTEYANNAQFWMRIDGQNGETMGFDNMQDRPIRGSTDWQKYEIILDVSEAALNIAFGVLLTKGGQAWVDDLQFEVVSQDISSTNMLSHNVSNNRKNRLSNKNYPGKPINLNFEHRSGNLIADINPNGWIKTESHPQHYEARADTTVKKSGYSSTYLKFIGNEFESYGSLMKMTGAVDYRGKRLKMSAYIRSENTKQAQLWMTITGKHRKGMRYDNVRNHPVRESTDWQRYEIILDIPNTAESIAFGISLRNGGQVWVDDTQFQILPPLWRTWWAFGVYFLAFLVLFYFAWRIRLGQLRLKHSLEIKQIEAENLHKVDQIKCQFFTNMSHEFRTPLTLILGPLEEMLAKAKDSKTIIDLKLMRRNARHLLRLINQILDLGKLESGRMQLQTRLQNMVEISNRCIQAFESQARLKGIKLLFDSASDNISAYVDADKIEDIICNLMSNALKVTPRGGAIQVWIDHPMETSNCVRITIADSGPGIPPDKLEKIFDRFYQVDESRTRKYEGTGIGLALTKELVELHHGHISVSSEPGRGATFVVDLPLGRAHLSPEEIKDETDDKLAGVSEPTDFTETPETTEQPVARERSLSESVIEMARTSAPLLLIVEDNPDMQHYIRDILQSDYTIILAQDGQDGLDKAIETIPDLIISDVMMPTLDGYALCDTLKTDERTSHIPIILLTARASEKSKITGYDIGADGYVIKPFHRKELVARVKNLIINRQKLKERFRQEITVEPEHLPVTSSDARFLERAVNIVEEHLTDPEFSVEYFVHQVGLSHTQCNRKLRGLLNMSAVEFIRSIRLKRGARLLQEKFGSVAQVAYEVGFNNPSYFAECFRKQFGVSPSEYQKKE